MARTYNELTIKQLFISCGHYCPYPECAAELVELSGDEPIILGEIAHIEASSDVGPRGNPNLTARDRDRYANLLILCPTHHTLVDKAPDRFPSAVLRGWKSAAEERTRQQLAAGILSVTFAEISLICNAFADGALQLPSSPMVAVDPSRKMAWNGLTDGVRPFFTAGLALAPMIADYIGRQVQLAPSFARRLRAGFLTEYDRLVAAGEEPDSVYLGLISFGSAAVTSPQDDHHRRRILETAANAVLAHLFEICDVFEAPPA